MAFLTSFSTAGFALLSAVACAFLGAPNTGNTPENAFPTPAVETAHFEAQKGMLPAPLNNGVLVLEKSFGGMGFPEQGDEAWMPLTTIFEITSNNLVRSIANGRVTRVVPIENFGDAVFVRHGEYVSVYSMLKASYVHEGDMLQQGQVLGVVGKGYDEGILHFELRRNEKQINPLHWIEPSQIKTSSSEGSFRIR